MSCSLLSSTSTFTFTFFFFFLSLGASLLFFSSLLSSPCLNSPPPLPLHQHSNSLLLSLHGRLSLPFSRPKSSWTCFGCVYRLSFINHLNHSIDICPRFLARPSLRTCDPLDPRAPLPPPPAPPVSPARLDRIPSPACHLTAQDIAPSGPRRALLLLYYFPTSTLHPIYHIPLWSREPKPVTVTLPPLSRSPPPFPASHSFPPSPPLLLASLVYRTTPCLPNLTSSTCEVQMSTQPPNPLFMGRTNVPMAVAQSKPKPASKANPNNAPKTKMQMHRRSRTGQLLRALLLL